jgi:hypothetical protein
MLRQMVHMVTIALSRVKSTSKKIAINFCNFCLSHYLGNPSNSQPFGSCVKEGFYNRDREKNAVHFYAAYMLWSVKHTERFVCYCLHHVSQFLPHNNCCFSTPICEYVYWINLARERGQWLHLGTR